MISKKNKTRSSRMRSLGKRISKKINLMGGGFGIAVTFRNQTKTFFVNPKDTIRSLSKQIQKWCGLNHQNQDLFFNGNMLSWEKTIEGEGIGANSSIQVEISEVTIPAYGADYNNDLYDFSRF